MGQTAGFALYKEAESISSCRLFFLDTLRAGEYALQLVFGDVEAISAVELDYCLTVVDAPVITGGWLSLSAGTTASSLALYIDGYRGDPSIYTFSLLDAESGDPIGCTGVHTDTDEYSDGSVRLSFALLPKTALTSGTQYYLAIGVSTGSLYTSADRISSCAYERDAAIAVLDIAEDDTAVGGLKITVGGVKDAETYTVTAALDYDGDHLLYQGTLQPEMQDGNGVFSFVLTYNELALPLSAYSYIYISIRDENGSSDSISFRPNSSSTVYQSTELSLTAVSETEYAFVLTGRNLLLDLYEQTEPLQFSLKHYDKTAGKWVQDSVSCSVTGKRTYAQNGAAYFEFSGTLTTSSALDPDIYYRLYQGEEELAGTRYTAASGADTGLALTSFSLDQRSYSDDTRCFFFNFGYLPVEATLLGSGDTATAFLYDETAGKAVIEAQTTGIRDARDVTCTFLFLLPETTLDTGHSYTVRITSDGETVNAGDYSSSYSGMRYDAAVKLPTYTSVEEPVFSGDTSLTFRFYCNSQRNAPISCVKALATTIVNKASEIGVSYDRMEFTFRDSYWYVTLHLTDGLTAGTYTYSDYSSFTVLSAGTVVLGSAENTDGAWRITDCRNLPEGAYTGILYQATDSNYAALAELRLTRVGEDCLEIEGMPADLVGGSYNLEVRLDGAYLGTVSGYVSGPGTDTAAGAYIGGYALTADEDGYFSYREITYFAAADRVYLTTYLADHAYVRYSEDASFTNVSYQPIRPFDEQELILSQGSGIKTVYVQFRTTSGSESAVHTWRCERVEKLADPAIAEAAVRVAGENTGRVPEKTDFTLELVATSHLCRAFAQFTQAGGSEYYEEYPLSYKGETTGGYLFQCTLDSGDWPFSYYDFSGVRLYLTDLSNDEIYDSRTLSIVFGSGLSLDAWGSEYEHYTARQDFDFTGTATPGATVTVTMDGESHTARADESGAFFVALTGLTEGSHSLEVTDSESQSSRWYRLVVDTTAPVITSLKAALGENGNAAVSWTYTERNLKTFLLYRDDVLIQGSESSYAGYTDTNYIAVQAAGATFTLVAVDKAGNRSEAKTVTVGDTEAPTAPGTPELTAHGTKSITFRWAASQDNVAVYQYELQRDGTPLAPFSYTQLSYTDRDVTEGASYSYTLYAIDRAGNRSEASETASLSTAELKFTDSTGWATEYIKEQYTDTGVAVHAVLDVSDSYYDLSGAQVLLQYKAAAPADWSELELTRGQNGRYSASWEIENLTPGDYTVRFHAKDTDGTEKTTAEAIVTVSQDTEAPKITIASPQADAVIGGGKSQQVRISATDNAGVESVKLYYKTVGGADTLFATLTNTHANKLYYDATAAFDETATLASGTITLKAVAYDRRGNAGETENTVTLDNTPPAAAENFRVTADSAKISVLWTKTTVEDDFSEFKVYRSTAPDGEFTQVYSGSNANYYDDASKGIDADTTYYYYVTVVDKVGNESAATPVDYGRMVSDEEAPKIVSYLPAAGTVLRNSQSLRVSVQDNFKLASVTAEYSDSTGESWVLIGTAATGSKTDEVRFEWSLSDLTPGTYQVRYTAVDSAGNTGAATVTYVVEDYTPPVSPVLSAVGAHRSVVLSWTYDGSTAQLARFEIYRAKGEDGQYTPVASTTGSTWTDKKVTVGTTYLYKVRAVDDYDAYAESDAVTAVPILSDNEAPVACITMRVPVVAVGNVLNFDGSGSTDNDVIESYAWDFGDGATGTGESCSHNFAAAGTYSVKLTVTDAAGNTHSTAVSVRVIELTEESEYVYANFSVVNGSDGITPIANAEIQISSEDGSQPVATVTTGKDGKVSVLLKQGAYTVHTIADGCYGRTAAVMISRERGDVVIGLSGAGSIKGSLTATEMTLEEIKAAGIDLDAADNQQIYRGALVLSFSKLERTLSFNIYFDAKGSVLGCGNADGGIGFGDGYRFDLGGGMGGTLYPVNKNVYMIVYTKTCWLKEMFNVELVVLNDSAVDTMDATTATLDLPKGLSLASMKASAQNACISLGSIAPGETATANWYICGDKEGEYDLTACVKGVFMPNPEAFEVKFVTPEPVRVLAGSALHLYVEAEKYAAKGQDYRISFRLENVSNKELYHVGLNVLGGRILEKYNVTDLEYEGDGSGLSGSWNSGDGTLFVETLAPGESISGMFKIVFDADFIEADATYVLNNLFMHTMEGSTTEINITTGFIDREDLAIIVIPGIMGSELLTTEDGNQVWIPTELDKYGVALLNGRYGEALQYLLTDLLCNYVSETNGNDEAKGFFGRKIESLLYAMDALPVSSGDPEAFAGITVYDAGADQYGTADLCSTMMHAMASVTSNVYLFSYDWRNDNRLAAQELNELIQKIRADDEKIKDVVIVAHSMGGLVSSSYAAQYGLEDVTNIITVGTPYLGTPKGTYMLELLDNAESIVGGALAKLFAWVSTKTLAAGLGISWIEEFIVGQLTKPLISGAVEPFFTDQADGLVEKLGISTLAQYYHGLYQLLPSPEYGGYILREKYGSVRPQEAERSVLNNMMEHYTDVQDHINLITDAYQFHSELGEASGQVLLNSEKCYFIVGAGQRTLSYLVPETASHGTEHTFSDVEVASGDGTVTGVSATMKGQIPDERSLYIAAEHTPLFAASNSINAIKDLIYGDAGSFGKGSEFEPLEAYTKIKVECPVELTITQGEEILNSDPIHFKDSTSFGELYLLGSTGDTKVAFVDDGIYGLKLYATDDGTMDLTIAYHTGGAQDSVKSVVFTNVPLTAGGELFLQITPNDGKSSGDNGLILELDNDADGKVDQVLYPGDASDGDDGQDGGEDNIPAVPVTPAAPTAPGESTSTGNNTPEVDSGTGGSAKPGKDGSVVITPDEGYAIDRVLVNGAPVDIPEDGILTGLKSTDVVQVIFTADSPSAACPDVDPAAWYRQAVDYVLENGLMNGTGAGRFDPNGITNRAMVVTVLWRMEGCPETQGPVRFADVSDGAWYAEAVYWAASQGIVTGYGATFGPDDAITREQFATILWRYTQYKGLDVSTGVDLSGYQDAGAISPWAKAAMRWACGVGLMQGDGVRLMPAANTARCQTAVLLMRYCELGR